MIETIILISCLASLGGCFILLANFIDETYFFSTNKSELEGFPPEEFKLC